MNRSGDLRSISGQLASIPKKAVDQVAKEPAEAFEKVEEQTGVKPTTSQNLPDDNKQTDSLDKNTTSQKATLEIVKKMYEASETRSNVPSDKIISAVIQENPKKTPEEIQKLATTRQQLLQQQHMTTYFEPTFNPKKKTPRVFEQIEEEEKEKKQIEALDFQKEEKKKKELAPTVKQGTHEKSPGIAG